MSSAAGREGITLIRVVEFADITPKPDEDERKAILAALADEEAAAPLSGSDWAAGALPRRESEDDTP
jgi:hypothetical protein